MILELSGWWVGLVTRVIDAEPMPKLLMGTLLELDFQDDVLTIRGTTGRQKWGTLKQVTERYLWLGP